MRPERKIACTVALLNGRVAGFQFLAWPDPDHNPGPDGFLIPEDWAIIATFVDGAAQGHGIGKRLFAVTREAARDAGVVEIDATIRAENTVGLAYYSSIGFKDYRKTTETISKSLTP